MSLDELPHIVVSLDEEWWGTLWTGSPVLTTAGVLGHRGEVHICQWHNLAHSTQLGHLNLGMLAWFQVYCMCKWSQLPACVLHACMPTRAGIPSQRGLVCRCWHGHTCAVFVLRWFLWQLEVCKTGVFVLCTGMFVCVLRGCQYEWIFVGWIDS